VLPICSPVAGLMIGSVAPSAGGRAFPLMKFSISMPASVDAVVDAMMPPSVA
jgi:hypothetical protein